MHLFICPLRCPLRHPAEWMNDRGIYLDEGLPEGEIAFMQCQGLQAAFEGVMPRAAIYPQLPGAADTLLNVRQQ